jgi:hypothetical protein
MTDDPKPLEDTQPFEGDVQGGVEGDLTEDDELADEPADDGDEETEEEPEEAAPARPQRRFGRPSAPAGMGGPHRGRAVAPQARPATRGVVIDPSLRVRDRVSALFVIGTLVVFGAIFANALAFGHGGAFSVPPTPQPTVNVTPAPSGSASPSGSPAASTSPSAAPSPAPSPS